MEKLPEIQAQMPLAQALLLELYHILVMQEILTEAQAVERYKDRRKQFGSMEWLQYDS